MHNSQFISMLQNLRIAGCHARDAEALTNLSKVWRRPSAASTIWKPG